MIGFAGMTHLGLVSGLAAAAKGEAVTAFDPDSDLVARLAQGRFPIDEPQLAEIWAAHRDRVRFTSQASDLAACGLIYVAPDVPTNDSGVSDLAPVERLLGIVGKAAAGRTRVLLSQVPPGFTRALGDPSIYYQVETLVFGRAFERALEPERFILGCADPAQPLPPACRGFLERFGCPILPMRYESAELAKIAINCCLAASVTVANTLAGLAENVGADWSEIVPTLRLDRRIGPHAYLTPGLGLSGGNIERDLATVTRMADATGADAASIRAMLSNSRYRKDWPLRRYGELVGDRITHARLALWGLAYKENTHSTKNSPALAFLAGLGPSVVRAYDPLVAADARYHPGILQAKDPLDACRDADALAILTPWPEFRRVAPRDVAAAMKGRVVLDPYRLLDPEACRAAGLQQAVLGAP
ncbi:MAG TPA: UDP binding domain-containing protein [Hypericibacter adhaerens]|uniref:UDP-glucose 6-dehydrogenase n=1 Tax=Hypericibacter adhaerens TaxID=2602016 RepID=A0A5J6MT66_9PROT|nr:UDP binding domain-containing protein [Hypericibacter adhaerens]QEX20451.1 UDP-glucose 6-dehydrogenase [Hypericibacter adhaerens]HWA46097.1 UDP binding domain-containing protein [Hypericibacter adhaerens]